MTTVFICYGRETHEQVGVLARDIRDLGREAWFDEELTGGQAWWNQILKRIRECDIFAFALSPGSLESQACMREYSYAVNLGKTILPVAVAEGVTDELMPSALAQIQYVDYGLGNKEQFRALSKALNSLPPSGQLPELMPEPPAVPISYLGDLKEQIETSAHLSFEQQSAILLRLKQGLHGAKESGNVMSLLRRLRSRDDLYAKVADEIDTLLRDPAFPLAAAKPLEGKETIPVPQGETSASNAIVTKPEVLGQISTIVGPNEKPVSVIQTIFELIPCKAVWISLAISIVLMVATQVVMRHQILLSELAIIILRFASVPMAALLAGYVVWQKLSSRPKYYKGILLWIPLGIAAYSAERLSRIGVSFLSVYYFEFAARILFIWFLFVAIAFRRDKPAAAFKFALVWLAIGLLCSVYVGSMGIDSSILHLSRLLLSIVIIAYTTIVSIRSLLTLRRSRWQ